jgi:hypothetical protein
MPAFDKSLCNFLGEDLGPTGERVRPVLPVEDEDAQRQKPGSAASGSPCSAGSPDPRSARTSESTIAFASEVAGGSVFARIRE